MKKIERRNFIKKTAQASSLVIAGVSIKSLTFSKGLSLQVNKDYNILDFGAKGDGKTLNTSAIQKTIDKCAQSGGGIVVVPKGTFLTGGFKLKNNIDFHLEEGAVILGSPYMKDYQLRELLSDARYSKYLRYALVFAQGVKNITVSGKGTFDGNAQLGSSLGEFDIKSEYVRPCLLWFDECENVIVKDITYKNSGMWTETYSRCKNVHVDNIKVTENYFFNADGCNMLDCEDFIIENCDINAQDDAICLKGYTNKGCVRGIIRNNKVRSICNGIKMGTDSSGGFRDITIENNEVWQTGISGLALEIADGGTMENVTIRNIKMNVVGTPIFIILSPRHRKVRGDLTVPQGIIRNIWIKGIQAVVDKYEIYNELERKYFDLIPYASSITGFPGQYVEDVTIEDVDITIKGGFPKRNAEDALREIPESGTKYPENRMFGTLPAYGFYVRHVRGLNMKDINLTIEQEDGRPAFLLDDVHDSVFNDISVVNITNTPAFSIGKNCSGIQIDN
jgi:polygalacturonase